MLPDVTGPSLSRRLRGRLLLTLLAGVALVAARAAVSGAAPVPTGLQFAQAGRWFASPSEDLVYHVNPSAQAVDAQTRIAGLEPDSQVVQGETSG